VILIDTSVWIEHLRGRGPDLSDVLETGQVLMHPFVLGELACGNLRNRQSLLEMLKDLPPGPVASDEEVLSYIEQHGLMGRGIGYIDVHLLASVVLAGAARLWTRDHKLAAVAADLSLAFDT
jgi:hypothetical protein